MTPTQRYIIVLLCVLLFPLWSMAQSTHFNHTVKKGETAYSLARIYKITIDELYNLNPSAKQGLKAGEILRIPQQVSNENQQGFHTIKPGETLYRISIIYKVSASEICAANPGLSAENFKAGQVEQNFILSNSEKNKDICFVVFTIYLDNNEDGIIDASDEKLYQSGLVQPGYSVSRFNISRSLPAGEYKAIVHQQPYSFDQARTPLNNFVVKTALIVK